jgi:hypothetical protein
VLTEQLVGEPGGVVTAEPGQQLPRPRWADAVETSAGVRNSLEDTLSAPSQPGAYFLDRAGRRVGALVVNADPRESILDRSSAADISRHINARRVLLSGTASEFASMSFRSAARRSIAEPLLGVALALLVLEALVVGVTRRSAA